jgi:hypothetical protein
MSDPDPRTSVDFEPVAIQPPRRRRLDPARIGIVVVVIGLVAAIVKPWDDRAAGALSTAVPGIVATPAPIATAPPLDPRDPAAAVAVLAALEPHDGWGLRLVTRAGSRLVEAWQPALPTGGAETSPPLTTDAADIVAIGITAPLDSTPLDVRGWARGHDGAWNWLDLGTFASERPAADLLLPPPTVDGMTLAAWPPGRYRFDLLNGQSVDRVDLTIQPGVAEPDPPTSRWASVSTGSPTSWLGNVPSGAYVVVDGVVRPLVGGGGIAIGDGEAWLGQDGVASDWQPAATSMGVLLGPGDRNASGVIRRIAPDTSFAGPVGRRAIRYDPSNEPVPWIQFDAPAGDRFEPGVYAMDIRWTDANGAQARTWTVVLRPGPVPRSTTMLDAARRYAGGAGTDSLILSGAGRRQSDPLAAPVRVLAIRPSIGCGDALIDETPAVLGLGHGFDVHPSNIAATLVTPDGDDVDVPLRIATSILPGLTLIAPARGVTFPAGIYRFTLDDDPRTSGFTVCLGTSPFSG